MKTHALSPACTRCGFKQKIRGFAMRNKDSRAITTNMQIVPLNRELDESVFSEALPIIEKPHGDNTEQTLQVDLLDAKYPIYIDVDLAPKIAKFLKNNSLEDRALIVSDKHLAARYGYCLHSKLQQEGLKSHYHELCGGKGNKTIFEALKIIEVLEKNNFSRDATLIGLGGGVVGDIAGLVASLWYRGMNLVHIPSTLIAMIDSSVGGKCAVNFGKTINALGAYHHPIANFVDLRLLQDLPDREFNSGMAEIIKCALIGDQKFFDYLISHKKKIRSRDQLAVRKIIQRTIELKERHVAGDIREGGKRLLLNFGHTLGHAIEMSTQGTEENLRHGEGVSLGMVAILNICERYFGLQKDLVKEVKGLLEYFHLPICFESKEYGFCRGPLLNTCMKMVLRDKKRKDGELRLILLEQIGGAYVKSCSDSDILEYGFESVISA